MKANGQIALVYRRPPSGEHPGINGNAVEAGPAGYPWNPSGTTEDIAGITDPTGRILGLMPHPERHQDAWQRPGYLRERQAGNVRPAQGLELFRRAVHELERRGGVGTTPRQGALA